jgi:Uncharacterized conserved protein, contains S4-like domain
MNEMNKNFVIDDPALLSRSAELYEKAKSDIPGVTGFLTLGEQYILSRTLKSAASGGHMYLFGGCAAAERKRAFFLPSYYLAEVEYLNSREHHDSSDEQPETDTIAANASDYLTEKINAIRIKGSGYRDLTHRDYLGSILALGLERTAVGDICLSSPHEAVIFVSSKIAPFLENTLERIGGDTVSSVENIISTSFDFDTGRRFQSVTVSAASPRLDCAVRALSEKGSREDAVTLIESGHVELNYAPEYRPEKHITPGDALSIRGTGKFIIDSTDEKTKKGRTRITARKYV